MTDEIEVFVRIPVGPDGKELLVEHKKAPKVAGKALEILTERFDEQNQKGLQTSLATSQKKK